ncbi:MAG: hypothetical protein JNK29_04510 [Anaerolineales bacterium]|nr:hypothetical protein [Anaerolineales bacterium]
MRILTVDVGTGTQDVFLYDSALDLENGYRLVLPSPTMMVHRRLKAATARGEAVLLTGHLMGGGPSQWAARDHVRAGGVLYATPAAARTFNDDLDYVQREMGVRLVSDDEARGLDGRVVHLDLKDFDFPLLAGAFAAFGVDLRPDLAAVAVFDHGDAPPGYSDRQFRFDYLDNLVRTAAGRPNPLAAFAHPAEAVPASMTRLRAVTAAARAQGLEIPLLVMDTAPAAVLGATLDPAVAEHLAAGVLVANIGNFHCLAFRLEAGRITGLFEHHTGEVNQAKLDGFLTALADSTLRHQDIFDDQGHGALVYEPAALPAPRRLAVTGPRRSLLRGSRLRPYFAVPYGDMMLAGCFGLLAAAAEAYPEWAPLIRRSLSAGGGAAPWESD